MLYISENPPVFDGRVDVVETKGVQTLVNLQALVSNAEKVILVQNLHLLHPKYLQGAFTIGKKAEELFLKLRVVFHSKFLLPVHLLPDQYFWERPGTKEQASNLQHEIARAMKAKNVSWLLQNTQAFEFLQPYLQQPEKMELWFAWHDIACALNNARITSEQAMGLFCKHLQA